MGERKASAYQRDPLSAAAEPAAGGGAVAYSAAAAATVKTRSFEDESDVSGRSTEDSCTASDAKRHGGSAAAPPDDRPAQAAYEASLRHVTLRLECDGALETRVSM